SRHGAVQLPRDPGHHLGVPAESLLATVLSGSLRRVGGRRDPVERLPPRGPRRRPRRRPPLGAQSLAHRLVPKRPALQRRIPVHGRGGDVVLPLLGGGPTSLAARLLRW